MCADSSVCGSPNRDGSWPIISSTLERSRNHWLRNKGDEGYKSVQHENSQFAVIIITFSSRYYVVSVWVHVNSWIEQSEFAIDFDQQYRRIVMIGCIHRNFDTSHTLIVDTLQSQTFNLGEVKASPHNGTYEPPLERNIKHENCRYNRQLVIFQKKTIQWHSN